MANPKYADLPGIAHDQPDVYETSDLPESEQGNLSMSDVIVDQCDSVEVLNVAPNEAFNKFKGKSIDGSKVDFTDGIGNRRKTGYDIRSGDYEMVGNDARENENPLQAYNRISFEVKQLYEKVNEMKESSKGGESSQVPPSVLLQQFEQLQKELQDLHMEKVLGSEALAEMSDPMGSLHKKLLTHLDTFKGAPAPEKKAKSGATPPTDESVKYELYVRPDQAKLEQASKMASLEQRIRNLESMIGPEKKKMSFLTSNTDGKSINAAIRVLSSKLHLLDPAHLDQAEARFSLLQQCMQQAGERRQQADEAAKVAELFELVRKADEMSASLPQVVDRLVSLKELHEQAACSGVSIPLPDPVTELPVPLLDVPELEEGSLLSGCDWTASGCSLLDPGRWLPSLLIWWGAGGWREINVQFVHGFLIPDSSYFSDQSTFEQGDLKLI